MLPYIVSKISHHPALQPLGLSSGWYGTTGNQEDIHDGCNLFPSYLVVGGI